jgi:hypothetical protein
MATDNNAHPAFTVDISPAAWRQLASFPRDTYLRVQGRLSELAARATAGRLPHPHPVQGGETKSSATFIVGDFAARYELDTSARAIRLVAVENRLRTAPHEAGDEKSESLFE